GAQLRQPHLLSCDCIYGRQLVDDVEVVLPAPTFWIVVWPNSQGHELRALGNVNSGNTLGVGPTLDPSAVHEDMVSLVGMPLKQTFPNCARYPFGFLVL